MKVGHEQPPSREIFWVFFNRVVLVQNIDRALGFPVVPLPSEVVEVGHGEAAVAIRGCWFKNHFDHVVRGGWASFSSTGTRYVW